MKDLSEVEALEKLSRPALIDLVRTYARLLLTIDGLWFLEAEKSAGITDALRFDETVWRQYGQIEASRLKRCLSIERVATMTEMREFMLLSPAWVSVSPEIELKAGSCLVTVTQCPHQDSRAGTGLMELACKPVELAYLDGFLKELNPNARIRCLFAPPDEHPPNEWCKWEIRIEE